MKKPTAKQIIDKLKLSPLADEGGLYRQTYVSDISIPKEILPACYKDKRNLSTQIYYLLTDEKDSFSALHRLLGDEVFHFYLGDPIETLLLYPDGSSQIINLGSDIFGGEHLQYVVRRGTWQGSRLKEGGEYALLGTSMAPGFDVADFELGDRALLSEQYPEVARFISELTRVNS